MMTLFKASYSNNISRPN